MSEYNELTLDEKAHDVAFTETSFLLEILVNTIEDVMGGATGTVGVNAGRNMGKKLPIYLETKDLDSVLRALSKKMGAGFAMDIKCVNEENATIGFDKCAIREVCKNRNLPLGGSLCKCFHQYIQGIATELVGKPMRNTIVSTGPHCDTELGHR
jgi:hypothetical protein